MKVILYQPQIPQNTGTIVRTCAATGSELILVRPLGFSTSSRHLKRAGLDYWDGVKVQEIDDLDLYLENQEHFFFFSSKAKKQYEEALFPMESILIFGSETAGLPPFYCEKWSDRFLKLPMREGHRCLNLACSVSIALYEAWRQNQFRFPTIREATAESTRLARPAVAKGR